MRVLLAVPTVVVFVAYGAIAIHTQNPWPWLEFVHESGDRTLIDTIFYFEHAARELPLDLIIGVAIGGSVLYALPLQSGFGDTNPRARARLLLLAVAIVCVVIVGGTVHTT